MFPRLERSSVCSLSRKLRSLSGDPKTFQSIEIVLTVRRLPRLRSVENLAQAREICPRLGIVRIGQSLYRSVFLCNVRLNAGFALRRAHSALGSACLLVFHNPARSSPQRRALGFRPNFKVLRAPPLAHAPHRTGVAHANRLRPSAALHASQSGWSAARCDAGYYEDEGGKLLSTVRDTPVSRSTSYGAGASSNRPAKGVVRPSVRSRLRMWSTW